ncbi:ABC transporter permease [Brevundimonas sp.]|uniref:ABC transporter permease n=1 Tax=Brevundimonas sp. TaxID=1871086 RepID=UPI002B719AF7|nr:ABC transporter permease subunit [Brevundimonas sp.]HWQ87304.1 ABC transporter permease subunit [Brevundimonas sp.]
MRASISRAPFALAASRTAGRFGGFLWSAWVGMAGLSLIGALWQVGHEAFGDFILPAPMAVLAAMIDLLGRPEAWGIAGRTTVRAIQGLALGLAVGGVSGFVAGYSPALMRLTRPILTVMLGVPPIAWIVMTMIWFGSSDATVTVTVVVAAAPLLFIGAAEGVTGRDRRLDDMARAFGAGPVTRLATIGLRQMMTSLFPALTMATGTAFKVAVMAELLTNTGGVGGALADARTMLDVRQALAWVLISVSALLAVEYGLIHPIRSHLERWRDAARQWGVKR